MTSPLERATAALTATLRHHGVEMHPDDIRGLAIDAITTLREPSEGMLNAGERGGFGDEWFGGEQLADSYRSMIDAALSEGG